MKVLSEEFEATSFHPPKSEGKDADEESRTNGEAHEIRTRKARRNKLDDDLQDSKRQSSSRNHDERQKNGRNPLLPTRRTRTNTRRALRHVFPKTLRPTLRLQQKEFQLRGLDFRGHETPILERGLERRGP